MRTTLRVDDDLLRRAKSHAAQQERSLTSVFEEALRRLLAETEPSRHRDRVELPVSTARGRLQPGVDLDDGESAYASCDHVLGEFVRVVTHPRIFDPPSVLSEALAFATAVRDRPQCRQVWAGPQHWSIFARLCSDSGAKGNLVADAYVAALAIEAGCEWVTTDRDFSRFRGLRWRHPLSD